ncbi:MAG: Maf family protein [Thermotogota bacterium]|nr:Maf family protein [Thermotogota bacterium]
MKLILASTSPRRRKLIKLLGLPFESVSPKNVEEHFDSSKISILLEELKELSRKKAMSVSDDYSEDIVIGADTIVVHNDKLLEKPTDADDAIKYLKSLSGDTHNVYTGVTLLKSNKQISFIEKTSVTFREIPNEVIRIYVRTGLPLDKAGAYGIQDSGALFVEKITGDFYNVMGFPVGKIWEYLLKWGVAFDEETTWSSKGEIF